MYYIGADASDRKGHVFLIDAGDYSNDLLGFLDMTPFYKIICKQLHLPEDRSLVSSMQIANEEKLKELDENIKKAEESEGEAEIREAMVAKAHYLSKIGNKVDALAQFRAILDKTVLPGCRLDITFHLIRMGFFWNDRDLITTNIEKANSLIEEGGDWDRRNRLKVYRGLHSLSIRDFDAAAKHFLDAVATFTSYELMDYKNFIVYTVLTAMISLKRQDLRSKVCLFPSSAPLIWVNSLSMFNSDY